MGGRGASSGAKRAADMLTNRNRGGKSTPVDIDKKIKDKTLMGVENYERRLKHEEAFVFDKDGKLVAGVSGGNSSVGIPNSWLSMDGATITHGHPTGRPGFGGTLSFEDADAMASTKWAEIRAAASGQGEFNYILRRTSKANNAGLKRQLARDEAKMDARVEATYLKAFNEARKAGKSEDSARHAAWQQAVGEIDRYWKSVLPKYGFEYIKRNRKYTYNR